MKKLKKYLFCFFNFLLAWTAPLVAEEDYIYDFAVCAIFQNEAPYLKEWIEYHKLVGAEHFYLYNHYSQDNYLEVLQPYLDEGVVELVDWSWPFFQYITQKLAYMNAINKTRHMVKWLAVIDIDEYIVPKMHDTVKEFLTSYEKEGIGGVGINWQMFGTSFVEKIGPHELLIERLIYKALPEHCENHHVKTIVRPEFVVLPPHVHYFEYIPGYVEVAVDGTPFKGSRTQSILTDLIQINHYWSKDENFFFNIKIPRRLAWGESLETIQNRLDLLNFVTDDAIFRFIPALWEKMQ